MKKIFSIILTFFSTLIFRFKVKVVRRRSHDESEIIVSFGGVKNDNKSTQLDSDESRKTIEGTSDGRD